MKLKLLIFSLLFSVLSWGQVSLLNQNFGTTTTFPAGWTSSNAANGWACSTASVSNIYPGFSAGANAVFNGTGTNGLTHTLTYSNTLSTVGYTNITVLWGARSTATFASAVTFQWSSDGTVWNNVAFTNVAANATWALVNGGTRIVLPVGAENIANLRFRFTSTATNSGNHRIDDFTVEGTLSGGPSITLAPTTLTGFTYVFGAGPSANQTFTASGTGLTADILLTAPTNYEISTAAGGPFSGTVTLTQAAGTVAATTIYVRLKSGLAVGAYNGQTVVATSAGATNKTVTCSGDVTAAPATNDLCSAATGLVVNAAATVGNMTGSTFTAPFTKKDVWYTFTPTCTGIHTITVTGFTGDMDIELFSGSCPVSTTTLDSSAGTTSTETISTTLTSGTVYYLRVLAFNVAAETSAFTAQVTANSVLTLSNAGSPATGNISAGSTNVVIMGFTTTPTCATSYNITNATLTKSGTSTATVTDISNFRIFYDANSNGVIDGGETSVSGAGVALSASMTFTITGQTGIVTARKYLLVADVAPAAVNGRTIKINLSPNTDLTAVLTPAGTGTGTALGNTQTITPPTCTSAVIASVTPASGPVGTEVTITASSGSLVGATATFNGVTATVVSSSATQLVVTVPAGATTGNLVVTDGQPCNATTTFTVIDNDITSCQGAGNSFTDLIISEVYDSLAGNVWHMELYNPTNAAINLDAVGANYRLERFGTIGDAAPTRTVDISGTIAPGAVYLADLGTITDPSCPKAYDFTSYAQGINEQDQIKLTKENVAVDVVNCPNEKGYTITRNTTAVGPTVTFNAADWNTNSSEVCTDLGLFSATLNTPPTISAQPSVSLTCSSTTAAISVTAAEGFVGGNPLAYQWYVAAPGSATWTALTNAGVYSGTTSSILNISSIAGLDNYQYYCQVRENGATCYKATIAVKIPNGLSTTWNGTTWSNGAPSLSTAAIINGTYDMNTQPSFEACTLRVNSPFVVTVIADKYINVQNSVTVSVGATLDILNNGSLVQINDAAVNTGNIIMRRLTNVKLQDYVYWSSSVSGFTVGNVSPSTPSSLIWKWNPTVANANGGQGNWQSASGAMTSGEGYIVRAPSGYSNSSATPYTASFTGVPNNGIFTPAVARGSDTGAGSAGPNGVMRTATDDNWNLLGNPYPSAISINTFLTTNTILDGFVRLWTHGTLPTTAITDPFYDNFVSNYTASDYVAINGAGATSGPGTLSVIGAGQGFFVLMDAGAATVSSVTFNNSMRDKGYSNSQFYRTSNPSNNSQSLLENLERHRIWVDLVSPTNETTRTLVAYVEGATESKDRLFDALTDYKNAQNFYSLIGSDVMTIQGRSLPFKVEDRVPMGIKVATSGTYTIAIATVDGLFANGSQIIYLEDRLLNTIHNLTNAPYQFNTPQGIINDRFVLRYTDQSLGTDDFDAVEKGLKIYPSNNVIKIDSSLETIKDYVVYDVLGRTLATAKNVNTNQSVIHSIMKNNQALIVKVTLANGQIVTKKIIF